MASAESFLELELNRNEFKPGDKIRAEVTVNNQLNERLEGSVVFTIVHVGDLYPPMPELKKIALGPGESATDLVFQMSVIDTMPEGVYEAIARIENRNGEIITKRKKSMLVTGTLKTIEADLKVCPDSECRSSKSVYMPDETVYFRINSSVKDLQSDAELADLSSGSVRKLDFGKNYQAQASDLDPGSYEVKVSLDKKGYEGAVLQRDFAVIEKEPEIESASVCQVDGRCRDRETVQNCPQDCATSSASGDGGAEFAVFGRYWIVLFLAAAGLMILGLTLWPVIRGRNRQKQEEGAWLEKT